MTRFQGPRSQALQDDYRAFVVEGILAITF
jgi:hypothetical protein